MSPSSPISSQSYSLKDDLPLWAGLEPNSRSASSFIGKEERGGRSLAVAVGILGLIIALVVPTLDSKALNLPSATRSLVGTLRLTRAGATSWGTHFRVTVNADSYALQQLQDHDGDGIWDTDVAAPAWRIPLPPSISVSRGAGLVIEFDARGQAWATPENPSSDVITIQLYDTQSGQSEEIRIFPSGHVQEI